MTTTMKNPVRRRQNVLRLGAVTVRTSRRAVITVTLMLAGVLLTALLAVGLGKYHVAPMDVVSVLAGSNTSFDRVVILEWRLPRMLMALLVGAALGLSGAIFQAVTGNPLGSSEIVGVNFGAYTGALA